MIEIAIAHGRALPKENYGEIRFESFIGDPVAAIRAACRIAELDPHPAMFRYAREKMTPERARRWRDHLTSPEHEEVSRLLRPTLVQLGYEA